MERMYTVQELADLFQVKPRTIMDWLRSGRLRGFKLSDAPKSEWRVSEAHLQEFIKYRMEQTEKSTEPTEEE